MEGYALISLLLACGVVVTSMRIGKTWSAIHSPGWGFMQTSIPVKARNQMGSIVEFVGLLGLGLLLLLVVFLSLSHRS